MYDAVCRTNVTQDELQTLRSESSDLVRERDRLKEDISTLETSCSDKSGEIERLNRQLETTSAELKVKKRYLHVILIFLFLNYYSLWHFYKTVYQLIFEFLFFIMFIIYSLNFFEISLVLVIGCGP